MAASVLHKSRVSAEYIEYWLCIMNLLNVRNCYLIIHCICCTVHVQYCCRHLAFLLSIFSGMPSFGDSYQKTLFVTLERQLVTILEVSEWGTEVTGR